MPCFAPSSAAIAKRIESSRFITMIQWVGNENCAGLRVYISLLCAHLGINVAFFFSETGDWTRWELFQEVSSAIGPVLKN